ncbi:MAG: hypothetical protein WC389_19570 [Lutibacter sp.]|jgi:hypothetical protein
MTETNTKLVVIDPKEYGLEQDKASVIEKAFMPVITERDALSEIYKSILTQELTIETTQQARELRLKLVKVRTSTDTIHKTEKAFYLAGGKFVDAWKNKNITVIQEMESRLSEIENYFVNIEKKRLEDLKALRTSKLSEVTDTPEIYSNLEAMTDAAFDNLIKGLKLVKEQEAAEAAILEASRIENARLDNLETQRKIETAPYVQFFGVSPSLREMNDTEYTIFLNSLKTAKNDYEAEQEKIRLENERLQKEAQAKQAQIEKERKEAQAKAEAEAKKQADIQAKLKADADAKLKAEQEKAAKEKAEQQAINDKLQAELKAKADAETKAKQEADQKEKDRIAAEKKAAKAPVETKLNNWIDATNMTIPAGLEKNLIALKILEKFESFKKWAKIEIKNEL